MTTDSTVRSWQNTPCEHCHQIHQHPCPWVAAYEYHPDGTLKRIEFRAPAPLVAAASEPFKG